MIASRTITSKKAHQLINKGAIVVDVRDAVSFRDGTLPGAVNMTLRQLPILSKHPKTTAFVVIGSDSDVATVNAAQNYLTNFGYTKVYVVTNIND